MSIGFSANSIREEWSEYCLREIPDCIYPEQLLLYLDKLVMVEAIEAEGIAFYHDEQDLNKIRETFSHLFHA